MAGYLHPNIVQQNYSDRSNMQYDGQDHNIHPQAHVKAIPTLSIDPADGNDVVMEPHRAAEASQRLLPEVDHVKHRRTRSGCYTCRGRRVKVLTVLSKHLN